MTSIDTLSLTTTPRYIPEVAKQQNIGDSVENTGPLTAQEIIKILNMNRS